MVGHKRQGDMVLTNTVSMGCCSVRVRVEKGKQENRTERTGNGCSEEVQFCNGCTFEALHCLKVYQF